MREEERPEEEQAKEPQTAQVTHKEICEGALEHYEKLAAECHDWYNAVPKAINFYMQYGEEVRTELAADEICRIPGDEGMKSRAILVLAEIIKFLTIHGYERVPDDAISFIFQAIETAMIAVSDQVKVEGLK